MRGRPADAGTHVDVPHHFDEAGDTVERRPLQAFAAPAVFLGRRDRVRAGRLIVEELRIPDAVLDGRRSLLTAFPVLLRAAAAPGPARWPGRWWTTTPPERATAREAATLPDRSITSRGRAAE